MRGLLLVALGYAVISAADASVKWVLPEIGPAAAMIWRGLIGAITVARLQRDAPPFAPCRPIRSCMFARSRKELSATRASMERL